MPNLDTSNSNTSPKKLSQNRVGRMNLYTNLVSLIGLSISIWALWYIPADRTGLILFAGLAMLLELTSVNLFVSSRSSVSLSEVITIASIVTFGPFAGVLINITSGLTTLVTTSLKRAMEGKSRASRSRRTSFNMGMLAISAMIAGAMFSFTDGNPKQIASLAMIVPLVLTTVFEWLSNAALLIGVIALQTGKSALEIWNRDIRWQAPVSIAGGILGGGFFALAYKMYGIFGILIVLLPILATSYAFRAYRSNMQVYVDGLETLNEDLKSALSALEKSNLDLTEALNALENSNLELTSANESIRRLNAELFQSLARVFDMGDPYVGGHAAQVAVYAVAIATEMRLPPERIELIRQAAYLHDIGKRSIPEAILHKPGKLTNIEYDFIKKHTDIGAGLLDSVEGLRHLAPFVRHHHER